MYQLLHKEKLGPDIYLYRFRAPDIARYRKPGQFVIVRINEDGERIPITIADVDTEEGSITLIIQGKKTTNAIITAKIFGIKVKVIS